MYELLGSVLGGVAVITFFYGPEWIVKIFTFPHAMFTDYLEHREKMLDKEVQLAQLKANNKE